MNDDGKKTLRCSFCGKHEQQIHRMIQGPGVRICDECVHLCMSILNDGFEADAPALEDLPDHLPAPREIRDTLDQYVIGQEEAKIALVPGDVFGPGGEGYLRMSFANSYENVVEGCAQLKKAVALLQQKP